jgi:NCS1 family nucleobase:cation symporter-1
VGFAGAVGTEVPVGAQYIYNLNFFCGFIVAALVYYILCRISPIPATSDVWLEIDDDLDGRNGSFADGMSPSDEETAEGVHAYGAKSDSLRER